MGSTPIRHPISYLGGDNVLREQSMWKVGRDKDSGESVCTGKYGVIHEYGANELDIWVTNLRCANRIEKTGWKAKNHYDDGALFIRPFSDLDKTAKALKCRKRRQVTEAMRERGRSLARMAQVKKSAQLDSTLPS
jgi:hypothetical protein